MSVITEDPDTIGYALEDPAPPDDGKIMFHIEAEPDSDFALCGHRLDPAGFRRPLHWGIYDCPKCWTIYDNLPNEE